MEEIIKPLSDQDFDRLSKNNYAEVGSPDSTEEMKNLESRQAAVTLLQIKNYDPSKYAVKPEEEPHIMFNSGSGLPPSDRAREVMHCNAVIDIISKAVAVAQRENEEAQKYPPSYTSVIDRTAAQPAGSEPSYAHDYTDEKYAYSTSQAAASPCSNDEHDKEMDLSLYGSVKHEPAEQADHDDREQNYFSRSTHNYAEEYKQQVYARGASKAKMSKDSSSVYEDCSQSSSGSDPDRLQMDISQMSQVRPTHSLSYCLMLNCVHFFVMYRSDENTSRNYKSH